MREMALTTRSAQQTRTMGERLGALLQPGDVILLSGGLGVGKTTFTKGVAAGLQIREEVTSPTFTLVAEYEGRIPLVHMDLYRLYEAQGEADGTALTSAVEHALQAIGFADYLEGDAALLIEWPEAVRDLVADALSIEMVAQPLPRVDERVLHCTTTGWRSLNLLDEWVKRWLF